MWLGRVSKNFCQQFLFRQIGGKTSPRGRVILGATFEVGLHLHTQPLDAISTFVTASDPDSALAVEVAATSFSSCR